jgi:hypothetical protein
MGAIPITKYRTTNVSNKRYEIHQIYGIHHKEEPTKIYNQSERETELSKFYEKQ